MNRGRGRNVAIFGTLYSCYTRAHAPSQALSSLLPGLEELARSPSLIPLLLARDGGTREVRREPRGCDAEQPRWVQPVGDVPSPPPLWAWVTHSISVRAAGEGNAQVPEIRIRDPPQPPARLSAQGPRCGRLPCTAEFGAGG